MSTATYGGYAIMAMGVAGMVYAGVMLSQTGSGPDEVPVAAADEGDVTPAGGAESVSASDDVDDDGSTLAAAPAAPGGGTAVDRPAATAPGAPALGAGGGLDTSSGLDGLGTPSAPSAGVAPALGTTPGLAAGPAPAPGGGGAPGASSRPAAPGDIAGLAPGVPTPETGQPTLPGAGQPVSPGGAPGTGTVAAITPDLGEPAAGTAESDRVIEALDPDPIMEAAILRARSTLPGILDRMASPPEGTTGYSIKVAVPTGAPTGLGYEQMWMDNCARDAALLMCQAANDGVETGLKIGDPYAVEPEMIVDWMYLEGQGIHGGYTLRLMLEQMAPEQAEALRARLRPLPG